MNESNSYQTPGNGGSRQVGEASSSRKQRRKPLGQRHAPRRGRIVVGALCSVLGILFAYNLIAGLILFTARRPAGPIDSLGPLRDLSLQELNEMAWQSAKERGQAKLILSAMLGVAALVTGSYWWRFRRFSETTLFRSAMCHFRVLATSSFTLSCLSVFGAYYGINLPLTYDVWQIMDAAFLFLGICGFVTSVIALAIGDTAGSEAKVARRYYFMAWIGLALSVIHYLSWLCYMVFHVRLYYVIYDAIRRLF